MSLEQKAQRENGPWETKNSKHAKKPAFPSVESEACSVFRLKQKKFGVPTHKLTNSRPHLEKAGGGRARKKARMPLFPLPFLRMCVSVSQEFLQNVHLALDTL